MDWKLQLAIGEFEARRDAEQPLSQDEISSRFADIGDTLRERIQGLLPQHSPKLPAAGSSAVELMETEIRVQDGLSSTVTYISSTGIGVAQKGRYRLDRVLGEGGFGRVYLGFDEELQRQVAIKVPTRERFQQPEDAEDYLAEARTVASLDHPDIVPVFDMGRTDDGSIYIVSKSYGQNTPPCSKRFKSHNLRRARLSHLSRLISPLGIGNWRFSTSTMSFLLQPWHILLAALCGMVNERQQQIIEFQNAQIEVLLKKLGKNCTESWSFCDEGTHSPWGNSISTV
ncbi:MAG: protein kinase [Fuerstiella sp.]